VFYHYKLHIIGSLPDRRRSEQPTAPSSGIGAMPRRRTSRSGTLDRLVNCSTTFTLAATSITSPSSIAISPSPSIDFQQPHAMISTCNRKNMSKAKGNRSRKKARKSVRARNGFY
jgi:hypothetical protein